MQASIRTNSMLIALVFCVTILTRILGLFAQIPYNIVLMECIIALALIMTNEGKVILTRPFIILFIFIGGAFVLSAILSGVQGIFVQRILHFVMYGLLPAYCIQYDFDEKLLRRCILYCGFLYIFYLYRYAINWLTVGELSLDETMDLSYTALIPLFAAVWTLVEKDKLLHKLVACFMILLLLQFMLVQSANRGALIAALAYVTLLLLSLVKKGWARSLALVVVIVLGVLLIINLTPILEWIYEKASEQGVTIKSLAKMIRQMEEGTGIDAGRSRQYAKAISLIAENLGMPGGIGSYYLATGGEYPHNLLLDIGLELGVPAALFCFYVIVKAVWHMLSYCQGCYRLLIFVFCLSIPRLMVSSTIWENFFFWIMLMLLFDAKDRLYYGKEEAK